MKLQYCRWNKIILQLQNHPKSKKIPNDNKAEFFLNLCGNTPQKFIIFTTFELIFWRLWCWIHELNMNWIQSQWDAHCRAARMKKVNRLCNCFYYVLHISFNIGIAVSHKHNNVNSLIEIAWIISKNSLFGFCSYWAWM